VNDLFILVLSCLIAHSFLVVTFTKMLHLCCVRSSKVRIFASETFSFNLRFSEVEKHVMKLKLGQYPNDRHMSAHHICKMLPDHPRQFEPPFRCGLVECNTCKGLEMGRQFINECYAAQHRENSRVAVLGGFVRLIKMTIIL